MKLYKALGVICLAPFTHALPSTSQQIVADILPPAVLKHKLDDVISASRFLSLHRELCESESISDNELSIGKYLTKLLEGHNFTVTHQQVPPPKADDKTKARWNIYATPNTAESQDMNDDLSADKPRVLLTSHIDTVPPFIPYSLSLPSTESKNFDRKSVLVSGRGTVDAKACVAAQIAATMELLSERDSNIRPSDLALLFVVGEETRGDGMGHFSDSALYRDTKSNYKAVIFGEPTEGKLASGHKGIIGLTIEAHGKASHSGYPWLGRSANSMILPALMALDKLGDIPEDRGGLPRSDMFGNSTVNVGYISGGVAANVVPEYAIAKLSLRLAGGTAKHTQEIVTNAIKAADPEGLLDYQFTQGYGPVYLDDDVPGFDTLTVNYGTDVPNIKIDEGVKKYLYGPGSILVAHGKDEGLTVGELEKAVEDYKKLVKYALKS